MLQPRSGTRSAAFWLAAALALPALAQDAPLAVTLRPFSELAVFPEREASAAAVSLNESRISAEITARVTALPAEIGQVVPKGEVVARLDPADYELALRKAEAEVQAAQARLALAESQLKRAKNLQEKSFISAEALNQRETELQVARSDLALARAGLDQARLNLAKTTIRAPYRAVVLERPGQVGELATPGTPLLRLLDADRIEVSADVQARDRDSLAAAREIAFVTEGARYPLRLARISPALKREARTVEARLEFTGTKAPPGASGRIVWRDDRPHVPAELVVKRSGRLGVFVANSGTARFVPLPAAQEGREHRP
ncbi:MAG TPA: efflux RND transporter periplasmic adaptor subunit, partial [Pelomicrobium sp.]|nr:efflux RND transporter periplasmic adaptor subunit [Pelomicrobium sp.]